jgi:serine/threonine protein phosphatase 1
LIGDVIDRGSDSKGVVELLVSKDLPTRILTLCGNHEAMAKAFLQSASTCGDLWRRNGGTETLFSYGVDVQAFRAGKGFPDAAREFRDRLPSEHLKFLARLPTHFSIGDYYFCHAGVRPGVPLDRQRESDLLWIRDDFLSSGADFGKVVVHGHTPVPAVEVRGNRINIDTGAYISNVLTCLVLEGSQFRFLSRAAARAASLST